jgi:pimeloyl-ACP methyl ester carboxylesterase
MTGSRRSKRAVPPAFSVIDRGQGPPIVLLHGQPGSAASWDDIVPFLVDDHRLVIPDRMGYGESDGEAQGLAANADAVAELIGERALGPTTVVGHSWAGGVAVLLASRHPSSVAGLVLVGAACTPDSLNALDRLLAFPVVGGVLTLTGLVGLGEVLPRVRRVVRHVPVGETGDRLTALLPDHSAMPAGSLVRTSRSFLLEQRALLDEMPDVIAALGEIPPPVSVVAGEWDAVVPPMAAVSLARAIPGSELTLLPRTGHFVARDDPGGLSDIIRRTVERGSDSASSP